jgi:hypothetical protein
MTARVVHLDSYLHFEVREQDGHILLVTYPNDCPSMGDRGPYTPEEGTVVESWPKGEVVDFRDLGASGFTVKADLTSLVKEGLIWCGDDFWYGLRDAEKVTNA